MTAPEAATRIFGLSCGTHRGEWFGVPATGTRLVLPIHEFHRTENGRLTHTWHLEDWFGSLHQLGPFSASKEMTK